jgi:transcription elongation GreA/GreB family factor
MLPIAATFVRRQMDARAHHALAAQDLDRARRDLATHLERVRARARDLDRAAVLIEQATADGLSAARNDDERAETLRASALHARRLAAA